MPEAMGVEEHLLRVLQTMERCRSEHLIIDSISAAKRMGSESAAFDFLVRLLSACRQRGITCLFLNQTARGTAIDHISSIGISSLIDTVVVLDYTWEGREMGRSVFVLKSRGGRHSNKSHRLTISDTGLAIDPPARGCEYEEG